MCLLGRVWHTVAGVAEPQVCLCGVDLNGTVVVLTDNMLVPSTFGILIEVIIRRSAPWSMLFLSLARSTNHQIDNQNRGLLESSRGSTRLACFNCRYATLSSNNAVYRTIGALNESGIWSVRTSGAFVNGNTCICSISGLTDKVGTKQCSYTSQQKFKEHNIIGRRGCRVNVDYAAKQVHCI